MVILCNFCFQDQDATYNEVMPVKPSMNNYVYTQPETLTATQDKVYTTSYADTSDSSDLSRLFTGDSTSPTSYYRQVTSSLREIIAVQFYKSC